MSSGWDIQTGVNNNNILSISGLIFQHYLDDLVQRYNDGDEDISLNVNFSNYILISYH